ncbi:MAG: hypothetical protein ACYDA9_07150 [Terriglobia bacterium]
MGLAVREKAEYLGTFRWLEVFQMEMLARWVPQVPELEAKVLMGRHVWDLAQHADALGKRTYELRAPLHYTLPPLDPYLNLLRDFSVVEATAERLHVFYDVILPALELRYRHYLKNTDALLDDPSVRVVQRILEDNTRMRRESEQLRVELRDVRLADPGRPKEWAKQEAAFTQIVSHGSGSSLARGANA